MQRIVSLALLAALVGGGWSALQGVSPERLQQAVQTVQTVAGPVLNGYQLPQNPTYGAPAAPPPSAYGTPSGQSPGFAPPPSVVGTPTIRIASFNVQTWGDTKGAKPYVMDAIARVVRRFDVVAIQEIRTQDDYFVPKFLRSYVNVGDAHYEAEVSPRLGRTQSTEQYAFLYNTATVEAHDSFCSVFPDPEDRLHREPYVALFRTRVVSPYTPFTFTLINTHTDPDEIPAELDALYYVVREVQRAVIEGGVEDDVILLGDLNTRVQAASRYRPDPAARALRPSDLGLLARTPGVSPLIRNESTMVQSNRLYDNILIPSYTTVEFTGNCGVLDLRTALGYTLSEQQAAEVSDHQPVWGEFSAIEGDAYRSAGR